MFSTLLVCGCALLIAIGVSALVAPQNEHSRRSDSGPFRP
jgi:hypothetical protein